jgi:hypothetical protein
MIIENRPSPMAPWFDDALISTSFAELDLELLPLAEVEPVAEIEPPAVDVEVSSDDDFVEIVRANLHAAAQHMALGHEGPSFRECSRASCRDAKNLIPSLEGMEGATDAELEAVLDRVLETLDETLAAAETTRKLPEARYGGMAYSAPMPR